MLLRVENNDITIVFDKEYDKEQTKIKKLIHENLDPLSESRYHDKRFFQHIWDGRVKLCDLKNNKIPTGLFDNLLDLLRNYQVYHALSIKILDTRDNGLQPYTEIPDDLVLEGNGVKTIKARDYQIEAVKSAFNNQRGILLMATNAGKSACAYTIFKYLLPTISKDDKLLLIAPNKGVMNQMYHNFQAYLGESNVGIWGDGKKELSPPAVSATIQTIASAIKKPEVKLTSDKDKRLQRFALDYYATIMSGGSKLANLKLFASNYIPKYKNREEDKADLLKLSKNLVNDMAVQIYFERLRHKYEKLVMKKDKKKYTKYLEALDFLKDVKCVIVDEAQSASATSYQNVFKKLNNARMRIGMTGTLDYRKKANMLKIKSILEAPIFSIDNATMIERGYSAKPHIKLLSFNDPVDLEERVQAQLPDDLPKSQRYLAAYNLVYTQGIVENNNRNNLIAKLAVKLLPKVKNETILIMVNKLEHGENIKKAIELMGYTCEFLKGEDSSDERDRVISSIKQGKTHILIATKVLDVGIDVDKFKYYILCAAGKSYVQTLQRIGRLLRISPTKKDIYIFDIVDRMSSLLFKQAKERAKYYRDQKFEIMK